MPGAVRAELCQSSVFAGTVPREARVRAIRVGHIHLHDQQLLSHILKVHKRNDQQGNLSLPRCLKSVQQAIQLLDNVIEYGTIHLELCMELCRTQMKLDYIFYTSTQQEQGAGRMSR